MTAMNDIFSIWFAMEAAFDARATTEWMRNHTEVPIAAVGLYLGFIFTMPKVLQKPLNLKLSFAMWNLLLSIFSIIGVTRIVPHLFSALFERGYLYTVCEEPEWYDKGAAGLWMVLFCLSKFPELGDTVFLVLRKKPLMFLHWFHHTTVLLYCWHAMVVRSAPGIWFAAMNFSVHSVMYFYFFMANVGYAKVVQPIAPFITTIQILQMVGGIICLVTVATVQKASGLTACSVDPANWKMGLMMYASYFLLFGWLFAEKYLVKVEKKTTGAEKQPAGASPRCMAMARKQAILRLKARRSTSM